MKEWKNKNYNKFEKDMDKAGFETEEYHGRFYYVGPAVRCDGNDEPSSQEVIRATTVKLQSDSMGRGSIWYPMG